jgi:hypothetical protein
MTVDPILLTAVEGTCVDSLLRRPGGVVAPLSEAELHEKVRRAIRAHFILEGEPVPSEGICTALEQALVKNLKAQFAIKGGLGVALSARTFRPWLESRKIREPIEWYYWKRYRRYLERQGWGFQVTDRLGRATDEILDLLGDPRDAGSGIRYGMLLGDVQSGKTSTYCALCCKAADAGYRIVILLAGTIESLRAQTQKRMDDGFIGLDSSFRCRPAVAASTVHAGVGLIERTRLGNPLTSTSADFNRDTAIAINIHLNNLASEPTLFVIKKNKSVLDNLRAYLEANRDPLTGKINSPVLLIDDEADNASVNTADGDNPAAINRAIRRLLAEFRAGAYVGVTATPFANVFIDPDVRADGLGDLFPKDFIYVVDPPSNYYGLQSLGEGVPKERSIEIVATGASVEEWLPLRHKIGHVLNGLPSDLEDAMLLFLLANAVRDLRGDTNKHRTMLVNVSRFIDLHTQLASLLEVYLTSVLDDLANFASLPVHEACIQSCIISRLELLYGRNYGKSGLAWSEVLAVLEEAARPVNVAVVNSRKQQNASSVLEYRDSSPRRLIVVGGNSLSRGLTLEGLVISYFYRAPGAYDTLMQMGRWFGYRPQYEDLVRVYLPDDLRAHFEEAAETMDDLRQQVREMKARNATPEQFGLKIRHHPQALAITARNKMRTAEEVRVALSFSGEAFETHTVKLSANASNIQAVSRLVDRLQDQTSFSGQDTLIWKSVHPATVSDFLEEFIASDACPLFGRQQRGEGLAGFIRSATNEELAEWDVALVSLRRNAARQGSVEVAYGASPLVVRTRTGRIKFTADSVQFSGHRLRVGQPGDEKFGMSDAEMERVELSWRGENPTRSVPDREYRKLRQRPLLIVYSITPTFGDEGQSRPAWQEIGLPTAETQLIGLKVSFPHWDPDVAQTAVYKINLVKQREADAMYDQHEVDESLVD